MSKRMKKLSLTATIYIVLSLLFVIGNFTAVLAAPDRILEPSFELVANWTYSETTINFTDGLRSSGVWVKQGTYSYLFSSPGAPSGDIGTGEYCQILQSVDFDSIDRISFDAYLYADSPDYEARMLVGVTQVWSLVVPESATEYLHEEVDLSGQTGIQDLIIRIYAVSNAPNSIMNCYFDNIKIWGSHSDATWLAVENSFAGGTNHAYMYGENFDAGTTQVGWYDASVTGGGIRRDNDDYISWGGGTLDWAECIFTDYEGVAAAGDWHAVVLLQADGAPLYYNDAIGDPDFIADDVFNVDATAIPEFPEVMASIGVAGLCFGIYYWMRKRVHRVHGVC